MSRTTLIATLFLILLAACTRPTPAQTLIEQIATPLPTATKTAIPTGTAAPTPTTTLAAAAESVFPLGLNNRWVYQATRYDALPITDFITTTHLITETVIDVRSTASYFAAKIERDESAEIPIFIAPSRQGEPLSAAASSEYWLVVQNNRIYRQEGNPDFLNFGAQDSLEFVFPLKPGNQWHLYPARLPTPDPDKSDGLSRQVLKIGTVEVPAGRFDNCFFIKDDWVTDTVQNWFCPGVGWVDLRDDHNGTPFGSHQVLIKYHISATTLAAIVSPTSAAVPTHIPTSAASATPALPATTVSTTAGPIYQIVWSPDGTLIAAVTQKGIILYDRQSLAPIRTIDADEHTQSIAFSPDGARPACICGEGLIKIWAVKSGQLLKTFQDDKFFTSVAFSPDGQRLAGGTFEGNWKLWDANGETLLRTIKAANGDVNALAFSSDSKRLLMGSLDGSVQVWEAETGQLLRTLTNGALDVAFSPDRTRVAVATEGGLVIQVWDVNSGQLLASVTQIRVIRLSFTSDGKTIVCLCNGAEGFPQDVILMWDASDGKSLGTLVNSDPDIYSLAFSPDGKQLGIGTREGQVQILNVTRTPSGVLHATDSRSLLSPRATLERFMQARIAGDEQGVLDLLTARLRSELDGQRIQVPFLQVSNPCWYRYTVSHFEQLTPTEAQARVRVYEHFWPGDNGGGLPKSWEQEISLLATSAGWRVDQLGAEENDRAEPDEPHGPTLSACTAWRQTPANAEPTTSAPNSRLAQIRQATSYAIFVPLKVPGGFVPDPPIRSNPPNDNVQIYYRDHSGYAALLVLNGPAGCCLDADPRKGGEPVVLPNTIIGHFLGLIQPEYGGSILWWIQDQAYVALSGPTLTKQDLIDIAASMSETADIP